MSTSVVLNTILVGRTPVERRRIHDALVDRPEVRVIAAVATFDRACVVARRNAVDLVVLGPLDGGAVRTDQRQLLSHLAPFAEILIVERDDLTGASDDDSPSTTATS